MNLTLTPIYFPVTLPIVAPVGDTAACTSNAPDVKPYIAVYEHTQLYILVQL